MDRSLEGQEAESRLSWLRTGIVIPAGIAIIAIGSWIVRTYPGWPANTVPSAHIHYPVAGEMI